MAGNPWRAGRLRKMGRDAYSPDSAPDDLNPFKGDGQYASKWGADMYAEDWQKGWDEAAKALKDEAAQRVKDRQNRESEYQQWVEDNAQHLLRFLQEHGRDIWKSGFFTERSN